MNGVVQHVQNNMPVYSHDCLKSLRIDELTQTLVVLRNLLFVSDEASTRLSG